MRLRIVGGVHDVIYISALHEWQSSAAFSPPSSGHQKTWDLPLVRVKSEAVMNSAHNQADRAQLITVSSRHAGDFISAIPSSAVGTRLDNSSLRCSEQVNAAGSHGLACRKSAGRHFRHNVVNDLIKRALVSADTPYWSQHRLVAVMAKDPMVSRLCHGLDDAP